MKEPILLLIALFGIAAAFFLWQEISDIADALFGQKQRQPT